jgi:succinate-acetate transporter protein
VNPVATWNTLGATAFSSYGAFWISYWVFVAFFAKGVPETGGRSLPDRLAGPMKITKGLA